MNKIKHINVLLTVVLFLVLVVNGIAFATEKNELVTEAYK